MVRIANWMGLGLTYRHSATPSQPKENDPQQRNKNILPHWDYCTGSLLEFLSVVVVDVRVVWSSIFTYSEAINVRCAIHQVNDLYRYFFVCCQAPGKPYYSLRAFPNGLF